MSPEQIAAFAAAAVAVIGALTTLIIQIRTLIGEMRRNTVITSKGVQVGLENHEMINSQRTAMIEQQTRTDNILRSHGIPIPPNPAADTQVSGTGVE